MDKQNIDEKNMDNRTRMTRRKNLSPDPSPQGRGALPKGRILLFRTMVSAAPAELPLSSWRGGWGERFGDREKSLRPLRLCV
jgi:hypothetical protein